MNPNGMDFNDYFYSLVKPKSPRKKRPCLRCRKVFLSDSSGNRMCAQCKEIRVGAVEFTQHISIQSTPGYRVG
jgi:ribosomal protein S27AE